MRLTTRNDFIATLKPGLAANWEICKREQLWGIVGRGANWRKNAETVEGGDRVFIWQGGPPSNGFIAEVRALGTADFVGPTTQVPWPNRDWFGAVFPIEVVHEVHPPLRDRFPNENGRFGERYGFNNTALQHIFEAVSMEIGDLISGDLARGFQD